MSPRKPLVQAAADCRLSYNAMLTRLLRGEVGGGQEDGKWFVEADERFERLKQAGIERATRAVRADSFRRS